jgi:hypothetical protein
MERFVITLPIPIPPGGVRIVRISPADSLQVRIAAALQHCSVRDILR